MGRRKTYDRETLIARAVDLFRDNGFAGTSAEMLVEALGANRYSIYAEFGSKQGLFEAALERYDNEVIGGRIGPLELPGAGVEAIRTLLTFYGDSAYALAAGRGCLLCNTAVEFGDTDPSGAGFVQRYFARLSGAFGAALRNAAAAGALRDGVDLDAEAGFFTSTVLGLFVMLRARAPAEMVQASARAAIAHLASLCASAPTGSGAPESA